MDNPKTLNVQVPGALYRQIERESRETGKSKARIVRDRLAAAQPAATTGSAIIADLFGVADDLPPGLSSVKDFQFTGYGQDRVR